MAVGRAATKQNTISAVALWVKNHRLLSVLLVFLCLVALVVGSTYYISYLQKFSREDYDKLTAMAETVLRNSGGKDIQTSRTCSYERPSEFANLHLYCRVELVTYLPYENDAQAIAVADRFESSIGASFNKQLFGLTSFYSRPYNGYGVAVVTLPKALHQKQCNFYIQSNHNARQVLTFPEKNSDDLIALSFECAAESRAEYFPVTYRQG